MNFFDRHTPHCVGDLVFENTNNATIIAEYAAEQRARHLLLFGPAGSGKSEAAKVIINSCVPDGANTIINRPIHPHTYQHDDFEPVLGSWNWQLASCGASRGYTVIDEVDQFTPTMRLKLRAFMDRYSTIGTVICTTNYLHQLDEPLRDRFTKLEFLRPSLENWLVRLQAIFRMEGFAFSIDQLQILFANFAGSARDLLEQVEHYVGQFRSDPKTYTAISIAQPQTVAPPATPSVAPSKLAIIINKRL